MFALPFMRRRGGTGGAASIPPGTYATPQDVAVAISQLIGGAPDVTLDTIAEIAARIINDEASLAAVSAAIANKQDRNAKLTALSALALAADKIIVSTGADTFSTASLTAFMRTVLAAADAPAARAAIGAIGSADLAGKQDANAKLTSLSALALAADKLILASGANSFAMQDLTAIGKTILASADAAAVRTAISALGGADAGVFGRGVLSLDKPVADSVPMTSNGTGGVTILTLTTLSKALLLASTPQAARSLLFLQSAQYSTSASMPLPVASITDVALTTRTAVANSDVPPIDLASGRMSNATANGQIVLVPSAEITVDAAVEIDVLWSMENYTGAVGGDAFIPATGLHTVVKCRSAGTFIVPAPPQWSTTANQNSHRLRVRLTSAENSNPVNVTSFVVRLERVG